MNRVFLILTLAPMAFWLFCLLAVLALGKFLGCTINEGMVQPCVLLGIDIGGPAYFMGFTAAWGALFLFPVSLGLALIWGLTTLLRRLLAGRR